MASQASASGSASNPTASRHGGQPLSLQPIWNCAAISASSGSASARTRSVELDGPRGPGRSAILGLPSNAPAAGSGLGGGPARRGDAEDAHRLQPEPELLAPVGGRDVEA